MFLDVRLVIFVISSLLLGNFLFDIFDVGCGFGLLLLMVLGWEAILPDTFQVQIQNCNHKINTFFRMKN